MHAFRAATVRERTSTSGTDTRPLVAVFQMASAGVGGVQHVTANVLPHLRDRFRFLVIDLYEHPDFAALLDRAGLERVSLGRAPARRWIGGKGSLWRPFLLLGRAPWTLLRMERWRRWIRRERPAVIYFNQLAVARVFGWAVPRGAASLVLHAHGASGPRMVGVRTARWLNRRFQKVLAVSRITARFYEQAGVSSDRIQVIYNAVDVPGLQRAARESGPPLPAKPPGAVVFVHVAAITPHKKAQHVGVDALAELPPDVPAHLWICGDVPDGGDHDYLQKIRSKVKRSGLTDRVHFLGWRRDVPRVLQAADACILPSIDDSESFGMVLAEAMALGKPCIGTTRGGVPEVIENGVTGIVCEPTAAKFGRAMLRLATSPELRESMGRAGRERVEACFALDRQVRELGEALAEAAGLQARRPR